MSNPFPKRPIPDSYQIEFSALPFNTPPPGLLLAGQYAGAEESTETRRRMELFLDTGVSLFVDLTEENEYPLPYAPTLMAVAAERNRAVEHLRLPIPDYSTPSKEQLLAVLDTLDQGLSQGKTIYIHCWGGIGRTGTVIGCWLVRHGLSGRQALSQIAAWRASIPSGSHPSPETEDQRQMIINWHEPTT
jgi:protein-tyrosine phosphatase